jgi:hypothetical protein
MADLRERAAFVGVLAVATALAACGAFYALEVRAAAAAAWTRADTDGDGLPLDHDRDADGDGRDFFDDDDADGDGVPDVPDIVAAALAEVGRPADPLMGKYGNLLGRAGFVVCVDIVADAWLAAGRPLAALLADTAGAHPEDFTLSADNSPDDPAFPRRVRNLRDLFAHEPRLVLDTRPQPGDLAFYGRSHVALVTGLRGADYDVVEAYDVFSGVRAGCVVETRGFGDVVFGRVRR